MRLIYIWKYYKIYYVEPGQYTLTYLNETVMNGSADEIKAKLNSVIDLYHEMKNQGKP